MVSRYRFVVVSFFLISSTQAAVIGPQTEVGGPQALCRISVRGVFQGSGTLISEKTVLTAAHVVSSEQVSAVTVNCARSREVVRAAAVRLADSSRARPGVRADPLIDFAVIELESAIADVVPLELAPLDRFFEGALSGVGAKLRDGMQCELAGFGPDRIEQTGAGVVYGRWDSLSPVKGPINSGLRIESERVLIKERTEVLPTHEKMISLVGRIQSAIRVGRVRDASAEVLAHLFDLGDRTTYAAPGDSGGPIYCFESARPWSPKVVAIVAEQSPSASDGPPLSLGMKQVFISPDLGWLK